MRTIGYPSWLGEDGLKVYVLSHALKIQRSDEGGAWLVFATDAHGNTHEARVHKPAEGEDPSDDLTDFLASYRALTEFVQVVVANSLSVDYATFVQLAVGLNVYKLAIADDLLVAFIGYADAVVKCELVTEAAVDTFNAAFPGAAGVAGPGDAVALALRDLSAIDGKPKTKPVTVDVGQWHNWHGIGDSATTLRAGQHLVARVWWEGEGEARVLKLRTLNSDHEWVTSDCTGDSAKLRWRYRDPVWLAGGRMTYVNAPLGAAVSMRVIAPAAALTPNEGGTGNAIVVLGAVVPVPGVGNYDVDLTNAAPIPAPASNGYWDYALPANMMFGGEIEASASPGAAPYHLFAGDFVLTEFISHDNVLGTGDLTYDPQNINTSLCLPEYEFECEIHFPDPGNDNAMEAVWRVLDTRYWTTV
jgi:hypothetical protein